MPITVLTDASPSAPALTYAPPDIISVFDYCLVDTLGWESPAGLRDANTAAYRSLNPTASGCYISVTHDASNTYKMRGYEAMTAPNVGTGLFPTAAQAANGVYGSISDSGATAPRPWLFISDGWFFWFFTRRNDTSTTFYTFMSFGDVAEPTVPGDIHHCMIMGNISTATNVSASPLIFIARNEVKALDSSVRGYLRRLYGSGSMLGSNSTSQPYPATVNGNLFITPTWIDQDGVEHIRGRLPGCYAMAHAYGHYSGLLHGDLITNIPGFPGKSFMVVRITTSGGSSTALFDITGPWR